jgi:hypothetical protein
MAANDASDQFCSATREQPRGLPALGISPAFHTGSLRGLESFVHSFCSGQRAALSRWQGPPVQSTEVIALNARREGIGAFVRAERPRCGPGVDAGHHRAEAVAAATQPQGYGETGVISR